MAGPGVAASRFNGAKCMEKESFPSSYEGSWPFMSTVMTHDGLKKLTVAQLKLICKEKRISGYSKLSKDPLVEKLLQWQSQQPMTNASPSTTTTSPNLLEEPPTTSIVVEQTSKSSSVQPNGGLLVTSSPRILRPPASIPSASILTKSSGTPVSQTVSTTKRSSSCLDNTETPPGKRRLLSSPKTVKHSRTRTQNALQESSHITASLNLATPDRAKQNSTPAKVLVSQDAPALPKSKPFKALLPVQGSVKTTKIPRSTKAVEDIHFHRKALLGSLTGVDLDDAPFAISLNLITLPPSISQRKLVTKLAIILSGTSSEDIKACSLVSKAFRYAAYLSAKNQLIRKFGGTRLDTFFTKYTSPAINFWPYLVHREREANKRKLIYAASFLADTLRGQCLVSDRLWSNPDHSKQAAIVARFLLTKMFFNVSVGTPGSDHSGVETIVDLQEVIPDEIWRIGVYSSALKSTCELYVLESTCEVVGRPPNTKDGQMSDLHLRADWSSHISQRLQGTSESSRSTKTTILDHLHWSNHEEYERGISKLWLTRMQAEGLNGSDKLAVANRYILASVVANGISGIWMSYTAMQQDFNGSASITSNSRLPKVAKLNLFVPAHHHIESVHFETSKKFPLHKTIAVVQTPGREYYILRDNGMQIGCEEEGVAEVWMGLLGCKSNGCPFD